MNKTLWRNALDYINPYIPGKSIEDVKKEYQLDKVVRLASNENPQGPSRDVVKAIQKSLNQLNLYPDSTAKNLREKLAIFYNISREEIMTTNGADNAITLLISSYVNEGDEVVYSTPTFPAYRSTTILMGGIPVEVPVTEDWCFDLNAMYERITDKTKLVIICNPNNPTGTIVSKENLVDFLDKVPNHVQVIVDEAYAEYIDDKDYLTGIQLFKENYPLITVRTFSKFYGLAGLRVGYVVAKRDILEPVLRIREPFATNRIAIDAAIAALDDREYGKTHLKETREGKNYLSKELGSLGFEVFPSHTNFLFVHLKMDSLKLFKKLLPYGLIIRPCAPWGLSEYARITIGIKKENELFIKTLQKEIPNHIKI
ncbi:histidinol-phosphate transaminase [Oceanobacillus sp. Castelsardo]|uniref:histidinol-phosphate transaminase n=1 Tax=Oceanobacillus sp. Castelsardo TaxID=1851204 RepID=UPI0008391C5D|nr:histidinol-phosphate transaminase [Oceanobacillus sp. Castelsardo]